MSHGLRAGCAAYGYNNRDLHSSHVTRGTRFVFSDSAQYDFCHHIPHSHLSVFLYPSFITARLFLTSRLSVIYLVVGALVYMENQLEPGHCCPIVMTSAAIPVLRRISGSGGPLDPLFVQKLATQEYDGRGL